MNPRCLEQQFGRLEFVRFITVFFGAAGLNRAIQAGPHHRHPLLRNSGECLALGITGTRADGPVLENLCDVETGDPTTCLLQQETERQVPRVIRPEVQLQSPLSIVNRNGNQPSVDLPPVVAAEKIRGLARALLLSVGANAPRESCTRRFARRESKKSKRPVQGSLNRSPCNRPGSRTEPQRVFPASLPCFTRSVIGVFQSKSSTVRTIQSPVTILPGRFLLWSLGSSLNSIVACSIDSSLGSP